jgi:hypothetical protein
MDRFLVCPLGGIQGETLIALLALLVLVRGDQDVGVGQVV